MCHSEVIMTGRNAAPLLLVARARLRRKGLVPAGPTRSLQDFSRLYSSAATKLAGKRRVGSIEDLPILFLFRHAIELAIKAVLINAAISESTVFARGHDLAKQLPDLQRIADGLGHPLTASLGNMVRCWNDNDPDGMVARYPLDKNGRPMQLANEMRFQLRPFVETGTAVLEELYEILEGQEFEAYQRLIDSEGIR
jgi:hypothetical protein